MSQELNTMDLYTWLANGNYTQTKVSKLYKYDSEIESF
jgi:hypothetical protein